MKLTLIGMYNATKGSLFEKMQFPTDIDKQLLINTLLLEYGEFETIYADVDYMKFILETWADSHYWNMLRLVKLFSSEYEPLHNYDRLEDYTDDSTSNIHGTGESDSHSTGDIEDKVSAYDSSSYQPSSRNYSDGTNHESGVSDTNAESRLVHHAHLRGNIGTTKTQEMFLDEMALQARANLYKAIANMIAMDNLLLIY